MRTREAAGLQQTGTSGAGDQNTAAVSEGVMETTKKKGEDTSDYSATKAPENREHVTSEATYEPNVPARPGIPVGMEALHRETVPSQAADNPPRDYPANPANDSGRE
jgi:hypothetical protein